MRFLDLTMPSPEENLACDEVLLDACEAAVGAGAGGVGEVLRVWESPAPFVVLGCGSRVREEVDLDACRRDRIPVLRRSSGGCAVLQGSGCLNFALVLRVPPEGPLTSIRGTNDWVTRRHAGALRGLLGESLRAAGLSDLALGDLKISGNSQRRKRRHVLVHGTFLLDFDLPLVDRTLVLPPRQPDYRRNRPHAEFMTNARAQREALKAALRDAWSATEPWKPAWTEASLDEVARRARTRHADAGWVFRF